jgi:hypothetical protein
MLKQNVKTESQGILITPALQKLIEFLENQKRDSISKHFKRVFELASFHSQLDHDAFDVTSLYFQYEFIEMLNQMENENECK